MPKRKGVFFSEVSPKISWILLMIALPEKFKILIVVASAVRLWKIAFYSVSLFVCTDWYGISYLERFKIDVPDLRDLPKVPESEPIRTEGQLVKHLLSGYQRRGRPVINVSFFNYSVITICFIACSCCRHYNSLLFFIIHPYNLLHCKFMVCRFCRHHNLLLLFIIHLQFVALQIHGRCCRHLRLSLWVSEERCNRFWALTRRQGPSQLIFGLEFLLLIMFHNTWNY